MDHTAFIFFWATVFRVRAEKGNVFPVPDGLDPAGCLGLRNSSPLCWAKPFFSFCWWVGAPITWGSLCAGCDAASPPFIDIVTVNLDLLLQRDMGTVV